MKVRTVVLLLATVFVAFQQNGVMSSLSHVGEQHYFVVQCIWGSVYGGDNYVNK